MRDPSTPKQPTLLGEDEAASMAEALLSSRQTSVTTLLESLDGKSTDPGDRREDGDFDELIKNSVFGRPEPGGRTGPVAVRSAPGIDSTVTGRPSPLITGATRAIVLPESAALPASGSGQVPESTDRSYEASFTRSGVEDTERRRKITLLLASLFTVALVASATITVFGNGSTVEAETQSVPTVSGVTQTAPSSTSVTTVLDTTVPAPPTTLPAPATEAPTTEAPTTEAPTTEAPTTTVPTTRRPTTTRPATTQRPPTSARPTTAAPAPTQVTLPDVTFSQPTWAATDPPPPPVDPEG